jgi:hypothetical protein
MADFQRKLLDEIMGKDRNASLKDKRKHREHYSDENVTTKYLRQIDAIK